MSRQNQSHDQLIKSMTSLIRYVIVLLVICITFFAIFILTDSEKIMSPIAKNIKTNNIKMVEQEYLDDYIENKFRIKNFNIDYAALIVGVIGIFMTIVTLLLFKEYEALKEYRSELNDLKADIKNDLDELKAKSEEFKQMQNSLEKKELYLDESMSRLIYYLNNKEAEFRDTYLSIDIAMSTAHIYSNNQSVRLRAIRELGKKAKISTRTSTNEYLIDLLRYLAKNDLNEEIRNQALNSVESIKDRSLKSNEQA